MMKTKLIMLCASAALVFAASSLCAAPEAKAQDELTFTIEFTATPEAPLSSRVTYKGANTKVKYLRNAYGGVANTFEDNTWEYKVNDDLKVQFSLYGPWEEGKRVKSSFNFGEKGLYVRYTKEEYPHRPQYISTPAIEGYKLDKVTIKTTTHKRRFYLLTSNQVEEPTAYDLLGDYTRYGETAMEEPFTFTFKNLSTEGAETSSAGKSYYLGNWTNGNIQSIEYTYVKE